MDASYQYNLGGRASKEAIQHTTVFLCIQICCLLLSDHFKDFTSQSVLKLCIHCWFPFERDYTSFSSHC